LTKFHETHYEHVIGGHPYWYILTPCHQ